MSIPASVVSSIEQKTGERVISQQPVGGGSINAAARITCGDQPYFLKWNRADLADMFETEAKGLDLLREASSAFKIPEVAGSGVSDQHSWLLLEWLEPQTTRDRDFAGFGQHLAMMHKKTSESYGLDHNNYIGRLPQSNTFHDSWVDFFINERISPQLKNAVDSGKLSSGLHQNAERLFGRLSELLTNEPASILHGDLWSGNFLSTGNKIALIDPAVYYGNREIELAFTQLFGGFSGSFYNSYFETWPVESGFEQRASIYNLYPLLVHVNLFGGGYCARVESVLSRY